MGCFFEALSTSFSQWSPRKWAVSVELGCKYTIFFEDAILGFMLDAVRLRQ